MILNLFLITLFIYLKLINLIIIIIHFYIDKLSEKFILITLNEDNVNYCPTSKKKLNFFYKIMTIKYIF